jgi:hypothetical protein
MAQTNFTPILTYKSDTATSVPLATDLTNSANGAELAVNTADKRLFTKNSGGTVVEIGTNPSSLTLPNGVANGVVYANGSKVLTTGSALTFDGSTLIVNSGATALSTNFNSTNASGVYVRYQNSGTSIGDIGAGAQVFSGGTAGDFGLSSRAGSLVFGQNNTEGMRLTSTGLGIGTSGSYLKFTSVVSATGSIPTDGSVGVSGGNSNIAVGSWNQSDSATFSGLSLETRTTGASRWLIANEWKSTYLGDLVFSRRNGGSTSAEAMRLDSSGNLGLGVTPSAWGTTNSIKGFQLPGLSLWGFANSNAYLSANSYYNGTNRIYTVNGFATEYAQFSGQHVWFNAPSGTAGGTVTLTQAMTLDASGNLGLATTSPTARLTIGLQSYTVSATNGMIRFKNDQNSADGCIQSYSVNSSIGTDVVTGSNFYITTSGSFDRFNSSRESSFQIVSRDGSVYWGTGGTGATAVERMKLDTSGNLLVGTTTALNSTAKVNVYNTTGGNGGVAIGHGSSAGQYRIMYLVSSNGALYFDNATNAAYLNSAGAWTNASDARLKNSITDIKYGLSAVLSAQPRSYKMNDLEGDYIGFVAQELQTVIPEVVSGDPAKQLGVDYGSLVAVAFKAIQEQQALITALTARLDAANL